jgi:hypothetical protein
MKYRWIFQYNPSILGIIWDNHPFFMIGFSIFNRPSTRWGSAMTMESPKYDENGDEHEEN